MHGIHTAVRDEAVEIEKDTPLIKRQLDNNHKELVMLRNVIHLLDKKLEVVKSQGPVEERPCLKQEFIPCTSPLMQHLQLLEKTVRELTSELEDLTSKIEL